MWRYAMATYHGSDFQQQLAAIRRAREAAGDGQDADGGSDAASAPAAVASSNASRYGSLVSSAAASAADPAELATAQSLGDGGADTSAPQTLRPAGTPAAVEVPVP